MELHAPIKWMFVLSLFMTGASFVALLVPLEFISQQGFWIVFLAYVVLALASVIDTAWTDAGTNQ